MFLKKDESKTVKMTIQNERFKVWVDDKNGMSVIMGKKILYITQVTV